MKDVFLKPGKERSLLRRHPWVFSGAVGRAEAANDGETVRILDSRGEFLALGCRSNSSAIALRVWSFDEKEIIDGAFFKRRIEGAYALRQRIFNGALPEAFRLVYAESDGLPGVIADIYAGLAVIQLSTAGADRFREEIADALLPYAPRGVYERSDVDGRKRENLLPVAGVLRGGELPEKIDFTENEIRFQCDFRQGHKTGFYLDQRLNRAVVAAETPAGAEVLNCFCYTGGFGLAALKGGAKTVVNVDSSEQALAQARIHARLNGFAEEQFQTQCADVFQYLRSCRDAGRSFDMIVLDPPKFADTIARREKAARGYKDLNLLALKLLRGGGKLFTFSCSGAMDDDLFGKVIAAAALDARADFRIVRKLMQGPDHPASAAFPEGHYLKGIYGIKC